MGQFSKPVIKCGGSTAFTQREVDLTKKNKPLRFDLSGQPGTLIRFEMRYEAGSRGVREYQGKRTADIVGHFTAPELIISGDKKSDFVEYIPSKKAVPGIIKVRVSFKPEKKPRQSLRSFNIVLSGQTFVIKTKGMDVNNKNVSLRIPHQGGSTVDYEKELESFTFTGSSGCKVRLYMTYDGFAYGHKHDKKTSDKYATGYFTNFTQKEKYWISNFTLPEANRPAFSKYVTLGVCGLLDVTAEMVDSKNMVVAKASFQIDNQYGGKLLRQLQESDNIALVGKTTEHPVNHYGTDQLISSIETLAKAYCEAYDRGEFDRVEEVHIPANDPENELRQKGKDVKVVYDYIDGRPVVKEYVIRQIFKPENRKLLVNDMSLKFGGRFACDHDIIDHKRGSLKNPFRFPHKRHMFGEDADISMSGDKMNELQEKWFIRNVEEYFPLFIKEGDHYHVGLSL